MDEKKEKGEKKAVITIKSTIKGPPTLWGHKSMEFTSPSCVSERGIAPMPLSRGKLIILRPNAKRMRSGTVKQYIKCMRRKSMLKCRSSVS